MPPTLTRSPASTATRCRRTTSRSPSSPSIEVSSSWPAGTPSARLDLADEQFGFHLPQHVAVLGLVARWSGDPSAALGLFDEADRTAATLGWGEPSVRWWTPDHVELLLEQGRVDDAVDLLDIWATDATRTAREWTLAHVTRCRGLVAAANGEVESALALLGQAIAEHVAVGDPFGRARAQLMLGTVRRRARQKSPARAATAAALSKPSRRSAPRAGPRGHAPSSAISAGARARTDSHRQSCAWLHSWPRAGPTGRSRPRCSSRSAPWPAT